MGYFQKIKATKLVWTQAWRRAHKKGKTDLFVRKRIKKASKALRSIQGISLEEIRKRRTPVHRQHQKDTREAGLRVIKDRKNKDKKARKANRKALQAHQRGFVKVPKN